MKNPRGQGCPTSWKLSHRRTGFKKHQGQRNKTKNQNQKIMGKTFLYIF